METKRDLEGRFHRVLDGVWEVPDCFEYRLPYLQEGTSRGGSGLDPGVEAAGTVRASPSPPRGGGAKAPSSPA